MKRNGYAFTMVELMIAISITVVIALSAAGASVALSNAYATSESSFDHLQTARSVMMKLQSELNRAKLVTTATNRSIIYWADDTNGNGKINLSELVFLMYHATNRQIIRFQVVFPESMDPLTSGALDVRVSMGNTMNVANISQMIKSNLNCQTTVLADDVSSFYLSVWPACPMTKLVRLGITAGDENQNITIRNAAALRADWTSRVGVDQYGFFLTVDGGASESDPNGPS